MINIVSKELQIDNTFKERITFICEFNHIKPIFINGKLHKIDKSNLFYIEPHKVIINHKTLLFFDYSTDLYISNLENKIKINDLSDYLKDM